jgi:hypothetical protein
MKRGSLAGLPQEPPSPRATEIATQSAEFPTTLIRPKSARHGHQSVNVIALPPLNTRPLTTASSGSRSTTPQPPPSSPLPPMPPPPPYSPRPVGSGTVTDKTSYPKKLVFPILHVVSSYMEI